MLSGALYLLTEQWTLKWREFVILYPLFAVDREPISYLGAGTEPKRTDSGPETYTILRTKTGTESFILINIVPEPKRNFWFK